MSKLFNSQRASGNPIFGPQDFAIARNTGFARFLLQFTGYAGAYTPPEDDPGDPGPTSADFATRSTAAGVVWAQPLSAVGEINAFMPAQVSTENTIGDAARPVIVSDPIVGSCMRMYTIGSTLAANFPASGGLGPRPMVLTDGTHFPDPAVVGSYWLNLVKPTTDQGNNVIVVSAKSGNTLTVTVRTTLSGGSPVSGQPFSSTQRDWVIGDFVGAQGSSWVRDFSALKADSNGLSADDVNVAGNTLRSHHDQTSFPWGSQAFGYGWYGHTDYHSTFSSWTPSSQGSGAIDSITRTNVWDGGPFYLSWREKIGKRFLDLNPTDGGGMFWRKIWMLQSTMTVPQQIMHRHGPGNVFHIAATPDPVYTLDAYDPSGGLGGRTLTDALTSTNQHFQAGSAAWSAAQWGDSGMQPGAAWEQPSDEWVAFLLHVDPGHSWEPTGNPSATGVRDTTISLKYCRQHESAWTTVYSVSNQAIVFGSSGPTENSWQTALPGYNAWMLSGYLNMDLGAAPPAASYTIDYAQVIFSKQAIAPPTPTAVLPSWVPAAGTVTTLTNTNGKLQNHFRDVVAPGFQNFYSKKIVNDFSGGALNPHWGTWGCRLFEGAGHSASNDNSVMALELTYDGAFFRRLNTPTNVDEQAHPVLDANWGEYTDDTTGLVQPAARHSWAAQSVVGPENGGATHGSFFRLVTTGAGTDSQMMRETPHRLDFHSRTGLSLYSRAGPLPTKVMTAPTAWQAYVPEQGRIYLETNEQLPHPYWFDLATGTYVFGTGTAKTLDLSRDDGCMLVYVPERSLLVWAQFSASSSGVLQFKTMDVSASQPSWNNTVRLPSVTIPLDYWWSCICWCPDNNRLILGNVSGDPDCVYEISIPTTLSDPWPATRVALNQSILWVDPDHVTNDACWSKWTYNRSTKCIEFLPLAGDTGDDIVYIYRPTGT